MSAITEKLFPMGNPFKFICQTKAGAQNDCFIPTGPDGRDWKGVWIESARGITGADAAVLKGTLTINNAGTAYTATTMSFAYDGGTLARSAESFYLQTVSGEILEVKDSAPSGASGTLTALRRACFGTVASATGLADDSVLYVQNVIQLTDATATPTILSLIPMPEDPGVRLFA